MRAGPVDRTRTGIEPETRGYYARYTWRLQSGSSIQAGRVNSCKDPGGIPRLWNKS